jgi:hypothetical protein
MTTRIPTRLRPPIAASMYPSFTTPLGPSRVHLPHARP